MLSPEAHHIGRETMRRIRNECRKLNWLGGKTNDAQQDPEEFFDWLNGCLGDCRIVLTRSILTEAGEVEANPICELFSSLSLPLSHPESGEVYPDSIRDLENLLQKFMC